MRTNRSKNWINFNDDFCFVIVMWGGTVLLFNSLPPLLLLNDVTIISSITIQSLRLTVSHIQSPLFFRKNHKNGIRRNGTLAKKSTIGTLLHHPYPSCARAPFRPNPPTRIRNPNARRYCCSQFLVQSSHGARCHITTVRRSVNDTGG